MSASPFTGRLVPRFPSCPPPPGQVIAATHKTPPASVAALSHSCPDPTHGQAAAATDAPPASVADETASGFGHTLPDAAFKIAGCLFTPGAELESERAVMLLKLICEAERVTRGEAILRALVLFAEQKVGLQGLAGARERLEGRGGAPP